MNESDNFVKLKFDSDTLSGVLARRIATPEHHSHARPKEKPVIVESPFKPAGHLTRETLDRHLDACLLDCISRGETPYASHQMLTRCLDDTVPEQREQGIACGLDMARFLARHGASWVFYVDYGMSKGMQEAMEEARRVGAHIEVRTAWPFGQLAD